MYIQLSTAAYTLTVCPQCILRLWPLLIAQQWLKEENASEINKLKVTELEWKCLHGNLVQFSLTCEIITLRNIHELIDTLATSHSIVQLITL